MGDETIQFASRYSKALDLLAQLAEDGAHASLVTRHGGELAKVTREALYAVEAVHGTGTDAVRDWPEQRRRVLAQLSAMRDALDRSGVGAEFRRMVEALLILVEPRSARG